MNSERIFEILKNKELHDVYYNERPVWIQEVDNNVAKIGFIDNNEERNVYIEDLYEDNLYNEKRETYKIGFPQKLKQQQALLTKLLS